jgi:hypothetical protein
MSYVVIFWGNSTDSKSVFIIQKKIIRIMAGVKQRISCRELIKKFNILPLVSEFLLSLLSFVVDNAEKFHTYPDICNINTRHKHDLHQLSANLTSYQKSAHYAWIKLFSSLSDSIISSSYDIKLFKLALNDYLLSHSYSVEEFTSIEND